MSNLTILSDERNAAVWSIILLVIIVGVIYNYFREINCVMRRLKKRGNFAYYSEYDKNGDGIRVSWHLGHKNSPEAVHVYEFNLGKRTCVHYMNTDNGRKDFFNGSLEEGLKKFAPLK